MIGCIKIINPVFRASISDKEIDELEFATQKFHDCYLMSSMESLSRTPNGRNILKEQIHKDDENPNLINCYLYNSNGEKEKYSVPTNFVTNKYEKLYELQPNDIMRSMDISVSEYEEKYKSKPTICRLRNVFSKYKFEYSLPSHFMKMLTGITPRTVAEEDYNIDLESYKEQVMELFERMDKEKQYSFVMGTGLKMLDGRNWHVYVVQDVDLKNNTITVKEKRANKPKKMNIDTALKTFKYITGYFNSDLSLKK